MASAKTRYKGTKKASVKINKKGKDTASESVMKNSKSTKKNSMQDHIGCVLQSSQQTIKIAANNRSSKKRSMPITKNSLLTKSGRIRKKSKHNLKLVSNILKRELMIKEEDNTKKLNKTINFITKDSKDINDLSIKGVNNNINGLSNRNNVQSGSSYTNAFNLETSYSGIFLDNINKPKDIPKKLKSQNYTKTQAKTKQVTLSNGVVLTLALFQCDYCQKTFSSKSSLRRHIYTHLNLKPFSCSHCSRKFRRRCFLQIHLKKIHPNASDIKDLDVYICHVCEKPFLLKENLTLHLASHVKKENSFKCVYCNRKFSHHLFLMKHEKQHLVTGRFNCSICNMSYDCQSRLTFHVKSHLKIKDFICQYCGKEFVRPNSVNRHIQVCHGGHRIQCPICNKHLKGHLTEHLRTHEKKRPHECPECGQRFTQSTQLNVHRRSHSGARPYPCQICGRPFSHSNGLMLHIRRHTGEKPFPCVMCPMAFSQLPHMKAHMRNIHGKNDPYKCDKCSQFFKLKVQLEAHAKICTVGDRELSFEEKIQASVQYEDNELESVMSLSRMRFLLALLLTMIASKEKLKYLGFNKRLIDDLLLESLEAMGLTPCKDESLTPLKRLKTNIQMLLNGTIPKEQMEKFKKENKTTEELLELLTNVKKNETRS